MAIALVAGIVFSWRHELRPQILVVLLTVSIPGYLATLAFGNYSRFKWNWVSGIMLNILIFLFGALRFAFQDIRNHEQWLGNAISDSSSILLTIIDSPLKKRGYYSTIADAQMILRNGKAHPSRGRILLRIDDRDSLTLPVRGDEVYSEKFPGLISSNANPGAFDFRAYCLRQGITHQLFLSGNSYKILFRRKNFETSQWLGRCQQYILSILKKYVPGKKEAAFAEALLIGYREDLDPSLVQAYANTGAVHIIAISGLHLGMIYGLLLALLSPFRKFKCSAWLRPFIILGGLWLFTLLAGASPSVLRSAVMFSFIALGNTLNKKTNICNNLAASAFFLLCINPNFLWDLGFQLSYAAVMGIAIFMKPVYHLFFLKNKIIDEIWKLNAITIAAQVLTLPICAYQFNQIPLMVLFANTLAVPLSGIILYLEIFLVLISGLPFAAGFAGNFISLLIRVLNSVIERMDGSVISVMAGIGLSFPQLICLYLLIAGLGVWLLSGNRRGCIFAILSALVFVSIRTREYFASADQRRIIVYQLPSHTAVDFVRGRQFFTLVDERLNQDLQLQKTQLGPSRAQLHLQHTGSLKGMGVEYPFIYFGGKRILLLNRNIKMRTVRARLKVDLVLLYGNPPISIRQLIRLFDCQLVVWDGSNSARKIKQWKNECDALVLRSHSVPLQGALMLDI